MDAVKNGYPYDFQTGTFVGANGGRLNFTGFTNRGGSDIFQRWTNNGSSGQYLFLDPKTGRQQRTSSPYPPSNRAVQQNNRAHGQAVSETSAIFREQYNLTVTTEVTIRTPGAKQASRLDQVLKGSPGRQVAVPSGYTAVDLRTGRQVSSITLDKNGFAGIEIKTGKKGSLERSQSENYQAAIEGRARSTGQKAVRAGLSGSLKGKTPTSIYLIKPSQ